MTQHFLRIISAVTALALLAACQDQTPLTTVTPTDVPIGVTSTPIGTSVGVTVVNGV